MSATPAPAVRVRAAQARVEAARLELSRDVAALRALVERRKTSVILGSGFVVGLAMGVLPTKVWAKVGAMIGGTGAILARSMVTPMVAGALMARAGVVPPEDQPPA